MKRKLIKQGGGGGLTFYVPKKWVDEKSLKAGDEIDVEETEGGLLLSAKQGDRKSEAAISISTDHEAFIRITVSNLYRIGYDKVNVRCSSKKQADFVADVVDRLLLGFEVTERKGTNLTLENITGPSEEKHDVLLRRVFLIIKSSMSLVRESLSAGSFNDLDQLKKDKIKVDQYINFLRRNISKRRFTEKRSHFYWGLYNYLLLIQHSLLHLCESALKSKPSPVSKNIIKSFDALLEEFSRAERSFFIKDLDGMRQCSTNSDSLLKDKILPAIRKSSGQDSVDMYYCGELSRLITLSVSPMLGILLGNL